jgi:hypothetical protein
MHFVQPMQSSSWMKATRHGFFAVLRVQGQWFHVEQVREQLYVALAARRAQVDLRLAGGDCLGVGATAGETALPALRLRQDGVDLVAIGLPSARKRIDAKAQDAPEHDAQAEHRQECGDQRIGFNDGSHCILPRPGPQSP